MKLFESYITVLEQLDSERDEKGLRVCFQNQPAGVGPFSAHAESPCLRGFPFLLFFGLAPKTPFKNASKESSKVILITSNFSSISQESSLKIYLQFTLSEKPMNVAIFPYLLMTTNCQRVLYSIEFFCHHFWLK